MLSAILNKIRSEPVLVRSVIAGAVAALTLAGITLPDDAADKVVDAIGIIVSFALMFDARNRVTPV